MKHPYDLISEAYSKIDSSLTKEFFAKPTFLKLLGKTRGKKVIDLGCGSGYSTRLIKETGSKEVVGVDISSKQILLAQEIEREKLLGIRYYECDVVRLSSKFKNFDIATAFYLLHYASTKDELYKICKNIYNSLKPRGRFIAINGNPDYPLFESAKYGIKVEIIPPIFEGAIRKVTYFDGNKKICSFNNYFWKKDTYEVVLKNAGFEKIEWHNPIISKEGIKKFGKEFWNELIKNPFICGLTCIKPFKKLNSF